jgi:hypothetical protein
VTWYEQHDLWRDSCTLRSVAEVVINSFVGIAMKERNWQPLVRPWFLYIIILQLSKHWKLQATSSYPYFEITYSKHLKSQSADDNNVVRTLLRRQIAFAALSGYYFDSLIDWLIDHVDGVRLCLRTVAPNGPIDHPSGDIWTWRAMVIMMMPAGDNSWLVHQSSLAALPAETSGASRRNGRRSENFAYQYLKYLEGSLTCRKILRHGTTGFTSHPKVGVLRIFIALKNPSPWPGLNPRPLSPVASTLTVTT